MGGVTKALGKVVGIGGTPSVEAPAPVDAEAERRKSEQEAAASANSKAAELARQRRAGSLLSAGGNAAPAQTSSVLAYGKSRLGE